MRLIDADKLDKQCLRAHLIYPNGEESFGYTRVFLGVSVKDAPTIEADPVVHGHWEKYKHHRYMSEIYTTDFRCSVCKKRGFHNGEMIEEYKYCPHCGARMDEVT